MMAAAVALGVPAAAQSIPGLENFTLARPDPTPTVTPTPTPSAPTLSPSPSRVRTPPAAAPTGRNTAPREPRAVAPAPTPTPMSPATPAPVIATDAPTPVPVEAVPPPAAIAVRWPLWAALAGAALVLLAGIAWWRRRREDTVEVDDIPVTPIKPARPARTTDWVAPPAQPASPAADPSPLAPPAKSATPGGLITSALKPELRIELRPLRGGVDTLRATLEYELKLINTGRGAAREVAVEAWLFGGGQRIADDLAELFASAAGELMLPPFELPPTATIDLAGVATVPRDALATITAGERRMFVPVLAARVRFTDARGAGHTQTAAFLVGVERDGQERLAPLPLDRGARMQDRLAARRYGA